MRKFVKTLIKQQPMPAEVVRILAFSYILYLQPGMAIPMLKIRRPNGRLIFNMEIAIRR